MYAIVYRKATLWRFNIDPTTLTLYYRNDSTGKEYAIYFTPVWGLYISPFGQPTKNLNRELGIGMIKFFDQHDDFVSAYITTISSNAA